MFNFSVCPVWWTKDRSAFTARYRMIHIVAVSCTGCRQLAALLSSTLVSSAAAYQSPSAAMSHSHRDSLSLGHPLTSAPARTLGQVVLCDVRVVC